MAAKLLLKPQNSGAWDLATAAEVRSAEETCTSGMIFAHNIRIIWVTANPAEYVGSQVVFQAAAAPERGQVAVVASVRVAAMVHRV